MNSFSFPIPASALQEFLPHRPPMVWVSRVLSADAVNGVCEVDLDPDGLDFSPEGLRQSSVVEWMAQSFGFCQATRVTTGSNRAFLAALRDVEYCDQLTWTVFIQSIKAGDKVQVKVGTLKTLSPITLASGEVYSAEGTLLAKATFKIYVERQN